MRTTTLYTFDGKTLTLADWSRETGISAGTLRDRIVMHRWPLERAFTQPLNEGKRARRPRPLAQKNLAIIARIAKATARARLQHQTGGQSRTSPNPPRTGVVSTAHDLHHHEGARP